MSDDPKTTAAAARAAGYLGTVNRLEPDIHMIDTAYGWASVAISLRRIADAVTIQSTALRMMSTENVVVDRSTAEKLRKAIEGVDKKLHLTAEEVTSIPPMCVPTVLAIVDVIARLPAARDWLVDRIAADKGRERDSVKADVDLAITILAYRG